MEQGTIANDSRQSNIPPYMFYCVMVATVGAFSNGWVIGSPNVPGDITHLCPNGMARINDPRLPDCLPMSTTLWGFAVSSFCVGGLIAGLTGGYVQTKLGRKKTIALNNIPWIIGAILQGAAVDQAMFIIGRLIAGLSCGLGSVCIPTYIGEISTIKARGAMGSCYQFLIVIGILIASVVGLPTATVPLWRLNFALVGIPAIFQLCLVPTMVDSPRWLISVNRIDEARSALQKLRGKDANIDGEFYEILAAQIGPNAAAAIVHSPKAIATPGDPQDDTTAAPATVTAAASGSNDLHQDTNTTSNPQADEEAEPQYQEHKPMSIIGIFKDRLLRHITLLVLHLHFTQQWIGMNAVIFYSTTIFSEAFDPNMSKYMAIATTGVNFVSTIFSVFLVDRMGRRALLLIAELGCVIFSALLVIGYRFHIPALLVVSVFLYVASFAIGMGPIPWMITSELCPTYANSAVSAVATCMNWSMNFLIGLVFPDIFERIQGYTFCIFVGVGLVAAFITATMLPETKNRSIETIVSSLRSGASKKVTPNTDEKKSLNPKDTTTSTESQSQ